MAALTSQKVRASYEQVLHVDRDGGGNGTTLVSVKDGDNGTTFALQLATDHIALTDGSYMQADKIKARDGDGLYLVEDANIGLFIKDGGTVLLNDTANTGMTIGLTINQAANDNEFLSGKSSDVAHGFTDFAETDTFCFGQKADVVAGGLNLTGISEDGTSYALIFRACAGSANTTKSTAAQASILMDGYEMQGTDMTNITADANVWALRTYKGGSIQVIVLADEDGDIHTDSDQTGGLAGTFDDMDDAAAVRALTLRNPSASGLIRSKFDDWIDRNRPDLTAMKIVGRPTVRVEPFTGKKAVHRGLINQTGLIRLHNGAIWQERLINHAIVQTIRELMPDRFDGILKKNMEALGIGHINLLAA